MTEDSVERCRWCGAELGGLKSSAFEEVCDDCGIRLPWEHASEKRVAIVGCGASKIVTAGPVEVQDLYTSDYFRQKREYGEQECDDWLILSAQHGLVWPCERVQTYDRRVSEHSDEQRGEWLDGVEGRLRFVAKSMTTDGEIVLLAGREYVEPIEPILETIPREIRDPFAQTSGIGEQRAWLSDQLATTEQITLGEVA